jgi:hypothetical protein
MIHTEQTALRDAIQAAIDNALSVATDDELWQPTIEADAILAMPEMQAIKARLAASGWVGDLPDPVIEWVLSD